MSAVNKLGNIEAAIKDSYAQRDAGDINYVAKVSQDGVSLQDDTAASFIHLEYVVDAQGHRNFTLSSEGISDNLQGVIDELKHTLSHLENDK